MKTMGRTPVYILTEPMISEEHILKLKNRLTEVYGPLRLRGRHSNRKLVLGNNWRPYTQNDIPWEKAERVDFYLRDRTENYNKLMKGERIYLRVKV